MNTLVILTKLDKHLVKNILELTEKGDKVWLTGNAVILSFDLANKKILLQLANKCPTFMLKEELIDFTLPSIIQATSYENIASLMLTHKILVWN